MFCFVVVPTYLPLSITVPFPHYNDVIMSSMASKITSLTIVYSAVYSGADQRKHQSSASLAFERGIHRGPVNSPHKGPVTRTMFPFDDVIMLNNYRMHRCGHFRNVADHIPFTYAARCIIQWEMLFTMIFVSFFLTRLQKLYGWAVIVVQEATGRKW